MTDALICDAVRTPFGRYGGVLSPVRADDLGAAPIKALMARHPNLDWSAVEDVFYGCANQAGEDNRNVARMSGLLAGLPVEAPGTTINRLCGSGLDAVGSAARAIKSGELDLTLAGGVENMPRAPFVMPKATQPFSRANSVEDTMIGWRFVNPLMRSAHGVDSMPETAENVADDFQITRADQDAFAAVSQARAGAAMHAGRLAEEIVPVVVPQRKGDPILVDTDEHPRPGATVEKLATLPTPFREGGSVTAGNASGVNDGACTLLLASEAAVERHGLTPMTRVVAMATADVPPRIMGFGPAPASRKVLAKAGLVIGDMDVIELNEAFASQVLAVMRNRGLPDDAEHVNPNGGPSRWVIRWARGWRQQRPMSCVGAMDAVRHVRRRGARDRDNLGTGGVMAMYWLLIARDKPGMEEVRKRTRDDHRAYIWRKDLPARLLVGSPLADDGGIVMNGSWLLLEAADRAAVEAFAADDPYRTAGLFDRVEILGISEVFDPSAITVPSK